MITFMAASGFLGAGKTTTLVAIAQHLRAEGRNVAIVTNDQGSDLVDTQMARSGSQAVAEVTGGCFCCRFEDLMTVVRDVVGVGADTVLAEAVGSCTDLQATVVRPLRAYYGDQFQVGPLVTVVEPRRLRALRNSLSLDDPNSDLAYLFGKQIQEADIVALNKADTLDKGGLATALASLRTLNPRATVLGYSAQRGTGIGELAAQWLARPAADRSLDIDYDRYANAEAALAWLNQTREVTGAFDTGAWAKDLLRHVSRAAADRGWIIGHTKVSLESDAGLTKMSLVAGGDEPSADSLTEPPAEHAAVRINARVACEPHELDEAIADAVRAADTASGVQSVPVGPPTPSFKPGYPTPLHRLQAEVA